LTLQIIHLLIKKFENGDPSPIDSQISKRLHMPIRLVHDILSNLVASGLVSEVKTKSDKEFAYQPARDINQLTIQSVLEALDHEGIEDIPVAKTGKTSAKPWKNHRRISSSKTSKGYSVNSSWPAKKQAT
jgi:membrane protein